MPSKEEAWMISAVLAQEVHDYVPNRIGVEKALKKYNLTLLSDLHIDSKLAMLVKHEGDGELFVTYRGTDPNDVDDRSADAGIIWLNAPGSSAVQIRGVVAGGERPTGKNWMYDDAYNLAVRLKWSLEYYTENVDTNQYPQEKVTVVGHSLGGFIAGVVGMHKNTRVCTFNSAPGAKYALVDKDQAEQTAFVEKMNSNVLNHRTTTDNLVSGILGAPSDHPNLPYGFMGFIDAWPATLKDAHSMKNFTNDPMFFEAAPVAHGKAPIAKDSY